jgi:hypothetical protein
MVFGIRDFGIQCPKGSRDSAVGTAVDYGLETEGSEFESR